MSLIEELRREMGLKSETLLASSTLGMRVMREELILLRQTELL
jgi:hypothetical protein